MCYVSINYCTKDINKNVRLTPMFRVQEYVLLIWNNLKPITDKQLHALKSVDEITYPFPN